MDGMYDSLFDRVGGSTKNVIELQQNLEIEEYDTDALLNDVPIGRKSEEKCNVASMADAETYRLVQRYIYFHQCMYYTFSNTILNNIFG